MLSRRHALLGLGVGLVTAPAIVRAASLMPVKPMGWIGSPYIYLTKGEGMWRFTRNLDDWHYHQGGDIMLPSVRVGEIVEIYCADGSPLTVHDRQGWTVLREGPGHWCGVRL